MLLIVVLFQYSHSTILSYNLYQSAGQLIQDQSNSLVYAVVGQTLLVESSDPVLTDRGAYFGPSQYIQLSPNFISSSIPGLENEFILLTLLKIIEPGVIFTIYAENTLRISIAYQPGFLQFSRGGDTLQFAANSGQWIKALIGYSSIKVGPCQGTGIFIQINDTCQAFGTSQYMIELNENSTVWFGASSSGFSGFLAMFSAHGDYNTPNLLLPSITGLSSNINLYSTIENEPCECGQYSCKSTDKSACIKCSSSCGNFCTSYTSQECLSTTELCAPKILSSQGTCVTPIFKCADQLSEEICNSCKTGYFIYSNKRYCGKCHDTCTECKGPSAEDCVCLGVNTYFDTLTQSCVCKNGFYDLTGNGIECKGLCDISCNICKGAGNNNCGSCRSGYFLLDNRCIDCDNSCLTCYGTEASNCLSCYPSLQLVLGSCIEIQCDPSCLTCSGTNYNECTSCTPPSMLFEGTCPPMFSCGPSCVSCENSNCSTCNRGYYMNSLTSTCDYCDKSCETCSVSSNNCTSCYENYTLSYNNKCVACDEGFYLYGDTCEKCSDTCLTCTDSGDSSCIQCKSSEIVIANPPGACVCKDSQYVYQKNPFECRDCPEGCSSCIEHKCLDCFYGYTLSAFQCIKNVLKVYFAPHSNSSISVVFSKRLKNFIVSEDLMITMNSKVTNFSLFSFSRRNYLINILSPSNTSQSFGVSIKFLNKIVAEDNSELNQTVYNCTIPARSNKLNLFDLIKTITVLVLYLAAVVTALASVFTGFQPTLIWMALNSIQYLSYTPLLNLPLSSDLKSFFTSTLPINILMNIWANFQILICNNTEIPDKYYNFGYTCHNIIINTGKIFFSFICGIGFLIILAPLSHLASGKFKILVKKKILEYKYSFFFRFWILHFMDVSVVVPISLSFISVSGPSEIANLVFGVILLVLIIASPILVVYILRKNYENIKRKEREVTRKFAPLVKEFRRESDYKVFAYYPLIFLKRIAFSFTAFYLRRLPALQIAINCLLILGVIVYLVKVRPFKKKSVNLILVLQEASILLILIILSLFLSDVLREYETVWTYMIIGSCAFLFVFNMLIGIYVCLKKIIVKIRLLRLSRYKIRPANELEAFSASKAEPKIFERNPVPRNSLIESPISSFMHRSDVSFKLPSLPS